MPCKVWLSDFGANALIRFDPAGARFTQVPLRSDGVWRAESGTDKLVVVLTR